MSEIIAIPERAEEAMKSHVPHVLRVSNIMFHVDISKASGAVIPVGVMAEILLPRLYGLGMIARVGLGSGELADVSELPKQLVAKPFDYLAQEFKEAWTKSAPGGALDYVAMKHEYSALHFDVPQRLEVPFRFFADNPLTMAPTLRTAVRAHLGAILDEQMLKLIYRSSPGTTVPQEEILQLKAA
jgi:hypothetical protein